MIDPLTKFKGLPWPGTEAWKVDECTFKHGAQQPLIVEKEHVPSSMSSLAIDLLRLFLSDDVGGMKIANARLYHLGFSKIMRSGFVLHRSPAMEIRCLPGVKRESAMLVSWLNCNTTQHGRRIQRTPAHSPVEVLASYGGCEYPVGMPRVVTHLYRVREEYQAPRREDLDLKLSQLSDKGLVRKAAFPRLILGTVRENQIKQGADTHEQTDDMHSDE
jgi:hypothetical protein